MPGTAVFMTAQPRGTPPALAHNLRHNKVLHEHVIILTVADHAHAARRRRTNASRLQPLGHGSVQRRAALRVHGRAECARGAGAGAASRGCAIDRDDVTYFLGRETVIVTQDPGHGDRGGRRLFVLMARNAVRATAFFRLPPDSVVELGVQVEI